MKVLVLGLPRTGTQSIADALIHLGIEPVYHMREVGQRGHVSLWVEALDAKFEGKGEPWGREQFNTILGGFEGLSDYPASIFPTELMAAYPEASVILSLHPKGEDGFYISVLNTIWHSYEHRDKSKPSYMAPLSSRYIKHCWGEDFPATGREVWKKHNALVREAAKGRKFLEYDPSMGWAPLCEFLGVKVPDVPYPREDGWAEYKQMVEEEKAKKAVSQ